MNGGTLLRRLGFPPIITLLMLGAVACGTVGTGGARQLYSLPKYGEDHFVRVRGYNLHYVERGEGRPMVLIPGAFTTYRTWDRVLPALSSHHRVFAVDYLGVGDSDKPEGGFGYSIEEQADVIAGMIEALQLSGVNVVGASYGGAVALNLAARYPELVHKVACIEGGALITPEVLRYSKLGGLIEWPVLGDLIWAFMKSGLFDRITARSVMGEAWDTFTPDERHEITEVFSANIMTVTRSSWMGIYRVITHRIDFIQALEGTAVPVLYLYGEASKYRAMAELNARKFEEWHGKVEVVAFRDGVHDLHLQFPDDVSKILLGFFGGETSQQISVGVPAGPGTHEVLGFRAGLQGSDKGWGYRDAE